LSADVGCAGLRRRAIEGLASGGGTVARRGGEYTMPGVHVNDATLGAMTARRALNRNTLSHTERLLQGTQDMVKQSEANKGGAAAGRAPSQLCMALHAR
jgi:hypothetical protein